MRSTWFHTTAVIGLFIIFLALAAVLVVVVRTKARIGHSLPGISWLIEARERGEIADTMLKGIALLKSSPPLQYKTSNGTDTGTLIKKQISLAILNTDTGELFEHRVWVDENEVQSAGSTGIVHLTPDDPLEKLHISAQWWNTFNTFYVVEDHPELVVIANKYLIERKYLPEQKNIALTDNAPKGKFFDMTYAPYSELLHVPQLVAQGRDYVTNGIDQAYHELSVARVSSQAVAGKLVTETVPKQLIENIIIIEHVDPHWIWLADDGGRKLAERVLVIIGANREWAFRYTGSTAGANGLAQFIEPTYKGIVARYPSAHMIKDFRYGMADHINAFKAMVLFFDLHMKDLQDTITNKSGIANTVITEEMLAATYNGGPSRVIRAVSRYGSAWITKGAFPEETASYIKKYDLIKNLALFD